MRITNDYRSRNMDNIEIYKKQLSSLRGKTIAIVYIFEGEKASGQ